MKVLYIGILLFMTALVGCRTPDTVGVSFGEQKLLPYDVAWRGAVIHLTWNLDKGDN